jgi:hypothetical protein
MKFKTILILTLICSILLFGCNKDAVTNSNCNLEPDSGNCEAYIPKYYFDQQSGTCEEFIWGGCGGTVLFDTLEECEDCECN